MHWCTILITVQLHPSECQFLTAELRLSLSGSWGTNSQSDTRWTHSVILWQLEMVVLLFNDSTLHSVIFWCPNAGGWSGKFWHHPYKCQPLTAWSCDTVRLLQFSSGCNFLAPQHLIRCIILAAPFKCQLLTADHPPHCWCLTVETWCHFKTVPALVNCQLSTVGLNCPILGLQSVDFKKPI